MSLWGSLYVGAGLVSAPIYRWAETSPPLHGPESDLLDSL